jgi:hypothetical protein
MINMGDDQTFSHFSLIFETSSDCGLIIPKEKTRDSVD